MAGYWRMKAAPVIEKVIAEVGVDDEKALHKALCDAYPFGLKQHFPYKVWCDEIKRQLGKRPALGTAKTPKPAPNQTELF